MKEYVPKTKPFRHQAEEFEVSKDLPARAIFWEQGTGKSKITIDTAGHLYASGKIDCVVVVAPSGVHLNWVTDEIPTHMPDWIREELLTHVYSTDRAATKAHQAACERLVSHKGLAFLAITYDSIKTQRAKELLWALLQNRKVLYVADESQRIKTPKAERTQVAVKSAQYAPYRRILSGTPIAQGPFDVFSQVQFLDGDFWKRHELAPFTVFKSHFGIWKKQKTSGGRQFDMLVSYRRLGELNDILGSISSRVTKEDVLDLPPKLYSRRYFEMTSEQRRIYDSLKNEFMALMAGTGPCSNCGGTGRVEYEGFEGECPTCEGTGTALGGMVSAQLAIVRLLRLQQVLCGYVPVDTFEEGKEPELVELEGGNPRLALLADIVEDLPHQFIVFARFRRDIDLIMRKMAELKIEAVRYDGALDEDGRAASKKAFQEGRAQAFVANPAVASEGLTLVGAKTVVYYNNSFKLTERLQSEDRAHRIGQTDPVSYIDLACPGTVDISVIDALRNKFDVASQITGDRLKEWLHE